MKKRPYRHWINNTEIQWTTLIPKFDSLDERVKFFEIYKLLKFIFKKITRAVLYLLWKLTMSLKPCVTEFYRLRWLDGEFYQIFMKEIISILHKIFKNIENQETLLNLFNEACIIMVPKTDKDILKENYRSVFFIT